MVRPSSGSILMRAQPTLILLAASCLLLTGCGDSRKPAGPSLTVTAAANLTRVMDEIATAFEEETKVPVVVSYGSTAQLAQQIEHGGPFDVFAAADTEHIDALVQKGKLQRDSRAVYARGQLVLWVPDTGTRVQRLEDLTQPAIKYIAVAQPDLAPYGRAAVEALTAVGIWEQVQPKVAYANSISMAKQYASSGNANVAFTALSLVLKERGNVIKVDSRLYKPLDQALAVTTAAESEAGRKAICYFCPQRERTGDPRK